MVTTEVRGTTTTQDSGLLLLRVAIGLIMAVHGAQQLLGWFGGGGIDGTAAFFASSGYSAATLMAVLSGLSHVLGGLALAVGLFTPLAAAAIIGTMVNAIAVMWGSGFFASGGGIEYELFLTVVAAGLSLTGPGRYALDRNVPALREHRVGFGVAGVVLGVVAGVLVLALFR
ncbi:DoxX family protein [Kibdelosporangium aridum]|uniref:Putative oxidoreductase n=1 Tax=Kibdelosporangium aridum TaxID=2030 RepID=A0A1W2FKB9_KIBAR|nr:DoxX family protein [Kibdelosporangium aridum]SMD22184.1 putative oxidoreductase [Kibdelosporangium aridum]